MSRLRKSAPALAISLVAASVALAAPAGDPRIEATDFQARGHAATSQTVRCDNGERVTSGGAIQSDGSQGTAANLRVSASGPDGATRWTSATSYDAMSSEYKPMRAFAICADAKTTINSTTKTLRRDEISQAHVKCGSGERAVGGGFTVSPTPTGVYAQANGPLGASGEAVSTQSGDVPREWFAQVNYIEGGVADKTVRFFAVCSKESEAVIKSTLLAVGGGAGDYHFAVCRPPRRALGGGVVPEGSALGMYIRSSGPLDNTGQTLETSDGDLAREWYGSVLNINGGALRYFHIYAICE